MSGTNLRHCGGTNRPRRARRLFNKKSAGAALLLLGVLGGAVAGYAYFTSTGTANGSGSVGSATNWSVTGSVGTGLPSSTGTR